MERVEELIAGKRRVFECYREALSDLPLAMNPEPPGTRNGYWMPTIVASPGSRFDRARLLQAFSRSNVDGRVFFWPLSSLPMFSGHASHPVSLSLSARAMNLPSYHDMTDADIARVVTLVREEFQGDR